MTRRCKSIGLGVKLAVMICLPVVLLALPADLFDDGPPMCLSVILLDMECYGCGMTRACQHLIHMDVRAAYEFNPLAFIVFPVLAWLWGTGIWRTYRQLQLVRAS